MGELHESVGFSQNYDFATLPANGKKINTHGEVNNFLMN
jgi:hypothetical protein